MSDHIFCLLLAFEAANSPRLRSFEITECGTNDDTINRENRENESNEEKVVLFH